jgi:hypothetical protein
MLPLLVTAGLSGGDDAVRAERAFYWAVGGLAVILGATVYIRHKWGPK